MKRALFATLSLLAFSGCADAPKLRGQIAALQELAAQAERNGAVRCAPRELATAQSELAFASLELEQGFYQKALKHVEAAEPNARAANTLSPPEYCTERDIQPLPGDKDGDGHLDPNDDCVDEPENYNTFEDGDGCPDDPDTDGDTLTDSVDSCVLEAEDVDGYLDEDGCPDVDNDLDGVLDADDACKDEPEDPDGFKDEDGCPDNDNDEDTVPDLQDQCPNEPGSAVKEPIGCPSKLVEVTCKEVKIKQQIHFEYNKATIRSESYPVLDAVVEVLKLNPKIKIEVQGHTDNRGSKWYNKNLSDKRANSVKMYLVSHGIEPSRLSSHGYGLERPIVPNDSDHNRALNRRVQFVRTEGASEGCPDN